MESNNIKEQESNKGKGFMKWALIFGIVIVLNLFFNTAIALVYKAPQYEEVVTTPYPMSDKVDPVVQQKIDAEQKQFYAQQKEYNRNVFIILVILGVISIVCAVFFANIILSTAFSWGGVLSLVIASIRYWGDASKAIQVLILAGALAGLIWLAIKKFGNK